MEILRLLMFEGPDKAGKSTLIAEVNRLTNYQYLCIDRLTGSAWVYDKITGRRLRNDAIARLERELRSLSSAFVCVVIVSCDRDLIRSRVRERDEYAADRLSMLDSAIDAYGDYARDVCELPIIHADTSVDSEDIVAKRIVEEVEGHVKLHR